MGTASSNKYGSRGQSCAVVHGRARSVVRGRAWSCVVVRGRAWSCMVVRGRAWSCMVVRGRARSVVHGRARSCAVGCARSCVRGRSFVVVRAWSCGRAVLPASRPALPWHERTNEQHLITHLTPLGWGGSIFFFFFR